MTERLPLGTPGSAVIIRALSAERAIYRSLVGKQVNFGRLARPARISAMQNHARKLERVILNGIDNGISDTDKKHAHADHLNARQKLSAAVD